MKRIPLKLITFIYIVLYSSVSLFVQAEDQLPPILDYYPNCSYVVLDESKVKVKTVENPETEVVTKLLQDLRKEAKLAGADALILLHRRMNRSGDSHSKVFNLGYKAQFIKQCKESNITNKKITPVDHQGKETFGKEKKKYTYRLTFPKKATLNHPEITNDEVSIINGVYGIKMGSSYQEVVKTFGDPSTELQIQPDELVIGYGRRHWLYFQEDKLVKIDHSSPFLSQEVINKIPLRKFFDNYSWKINKKVMKGNTLEEVKSSLNIKTELNEDNQLIFSHQGNVLTLFFLRNTNQGNGQYSDTLYDFTLKTETYKMDLSGSIEQENYQYETINKVYSDLLKEQPIDWQDISTKLGEPIGRIILTESSYLYIYNSHLLVKVSNSQVSGLYFIEQTLNMDLSNSPWNFGPFKQGNSIKELRVSIPEDAFEFDDNIEIESDMYNLVLFFDEVDGKSSLYEAKMTVY